MAVWGCAQQCLFPWVCGGGVRGAVSGPSSWILSTIPQNSNLELERWIRDWSRCVSDPPFCKLRRVSDFCCHWVTACVRSGLRGRAKFITFAHTMPWQCAPLRPCVRRSQRLTATSVSCFRGLVLQAITCLLPVKCGARAALTHVSPSRSHQTRAAVRLVCATLRIHTW